MKREAFFFQCDALLLPAGFPDAEFDNGLPLEFANEFADTDIFETPSLYPAKEPPLRVVSVLQKELPSAWKSVGVRQILTMSAGNPLRAAAIIRACHIAQWRKDSVFCGRCGARNADAPNEARRDCPKCGKAEFPRICPAVITAITDDADRILLARNKKFRAGVYSHISGFNEAGETLEETVVREIREEVSIEVKDIAYLKSQSWPFPNSLMLGFRARYLSGEPRPDGTEIEDAKWFTKDSLPEIPAEGSLSRYLINRWLNKTLE